MDGISSAGTSSEETKESESASFDKLKDSILFYPPESYDDKEIDPFKADIWALGITMYVTVCLGLPC